MRCAKLIALGALVLSSCATLAEAQSTGWGSRIRNLSWWKGDSAAETGAATQTPVAPSQSQTTFAPSPMAPRPSVTIPSATSPAGSTPRLAQNERPVFGSRILSAMKSAKETLTIKPREIAAPDPVRLDTPVGEVAAPVFVSAARVYEVQGRLKEAREHYEKALANDPKHLDALIGIARLNHREGNLVAATELYQQALRAHPNNPVALNDLGLCYARRDMLQQAHQSIGQAIRQDPSSKLYRNNLALVLVEMNRTDDALAQLKSVHGEAIAHYNLAYLLREKGQHDAAAQHLRTALQLDPRMEPARAMLARLDPAPYQQRIQQSLATPPVNGRRDLPADAHLGRPQIDVSRAAPVTRQDRAHAPTEYQPMNRPPLPVSHRQERDQRTPADVGPVRVRFENGNPADYRRGPAGNVAPTSQPAPQLNAPNSRFSSAQPAPSNPPSVGNGNNSFRPNSVGAPQSVESNDRDVSAPGGAPVYLRENLAPQTGGSRWSNPR